MSRQRQKKKNSLPMIVLIIVALALIALLVWKLTDRTDAPEQPDAAPTSSPVAGLSLPYALEDGKLEVTAVFQYTGDNPDCDDEAGEDIAALAVTNLSDRHLTYAEFTAELADGTKLHFEAADVPAGQSVWAFASDNSSYDTANPCVSVACDAQFEVSAPVLAEQISVSAEGTAVTLTNISGAALENLTVDCHCLLNEAYFGGRTYSYTVPSIAAGESVTIQAEDCYLGEAAVVRITKN